MDFKYWELKLLRDVQEEALIYNFLNCLYHIWQVGERKGRWKENKKVKEKNQTYSNSGGKPEGNFKKVLGGMWLSGTSHKYFI